MSVSGETIVHDILAKLLEWQDAGKSVALATVVSAWGSAPRPLGSKMAISSTGDMAGSVSGGCVETAVVEESQAVLSSGEPKLVRFGVSNETAWSVGLSCGGQIEVLIESLDNQQAPVHRFAARLAGDEITARIIIVDERRLGDQILIDNNGRIAGSLGSSALDDQALAIASEHVEALSPARRSLEVGGDTHDVFVDLRLPRPRLIVIGAVHVAIHLVALARRLGYQTTVIDPRTVFATPERFADADALVTQWPQEALAEIPIDQTTCLVFLSHDLKIDLPGLAVALRSPALYIGALGSKKTHAKRVAALQDLGFSAEETGRIAAPVGLDLGGRRAEEIALAIMAEIVAVRYGRRERA